MGLVLSGTNPIVFLQEQIEVSPLAKPKKELELSWHMVYYYVYRK